jgi:lysophospholipase L1-like esterase
MKNIMAISLLALAAFAFNGNVCAQTEQKGQSVKIVKASDPQITYSGRVLFHSSGNVQSVGGLQSGNKTNLGSVSFDWAGVHATFKFTGGYCAVQLSDTGRDYYNVFIDGVLSKVAIAHGNDTTVVLAENLSKGPHTLLIQKRTEGEQGMTTLHEFLLAPDGKIIQENKKSSSIIARDKSGSDVKLGANNPIKKRRILFIGNSLTCGYGTESLSGKEDFFAATENCNKAFACILSRYFHADYTLIAHSGRGVVRNWGDPKKVSVGNMRDKMFNIFDEPGHAKIAAEMLANSGNNSGSKGNLGDVADNKYDYASDSQKPDVAVINLGTNDFGTEPYPDKKDFIEAYSQIVAAVRKMYGNIPIICIAPRVQGPCFDYVAEFVEGSSNNLHLAAIFQDYCNNTTDLGASEHPNYEGQKKMAMLIAPYISTVTGWAVGGAFK